MHDEAGKVNHVELTEPAGRAAREPSVSTLEAANR
jgi:hypothetical protein